MNKAAVDRLNQALCHQQGPIIFVGDIEGGRLQRILLEGSLGLNNRFVLEAKWIESVSQVGISDFVHHWRSGGSDHHEVIVFVASNLDLIRCSQEVQVALKSPPQVP